MIVYLGLLGLGIIIGCVVMALLARKTAIGDLCIAKIEDAEVPYLALKRSADLDVIKHEQYVKLRVVNLDKNSQK